MSFECHYLFDVGSLVLIHVDIGSSGFVKLDC